MLESNRISGLLEPALLIMWSDLFIFTRLTSSHTHTHSDSAIIIKVSSPHFCSAVVTLVSFMSQHEQQDGGTMSEATFHIDLKKKLPTDVDYYVCTLKGGGLWLSIWLCPKSLLRSALQIYRWKLFKLINNVLLLMQVFWLNLKVVFLWIHLKWKYTFIPSMTATYLAC